MILVWAVIIGAIVLLVGSISLTTKIFLIVSIALIYLLLSRGDVTSMGTSLYMLRTKVGIKLIDSTAKKNSKFWNAFADWGMAVSFGLLSYFLFTDKMDKRMFILGMLTIAAIFFIAIPASIIPVQFINIPQIQTKLATSFACVSQTTIASPSVASLTPSFILIFALFILGGLAFLIPLLLFLNAFSIIIAAISSIQLVSGHYNYSGTFNAINSQIPGAAPVIPGITIPLFAGLIALIIILVIHEFSHGILARISKVKIKNTGLLFLLGVIPVGAFVEPDEKQISKLGKMEQNRISIAGVSANMLATIAFLVLMVLFINYVIPYISTYNVLVYQTEIGYPAYNVIAPGSILLAINNDTIHNLSSVHNIESSIAPMSTVNVLTNKGDYSIKTDSQGKIGVYLCESSAIQSNNILYSAIDFIFIVIALLFLLNFSIAAVNLLPIPGFDGWRIYSLEMKSRMYLLFFIEVAVIVAILFNILPLLTYIASVL